MSTLPRRLSRLETRAGQHGFAHLTNSELDRQLRAELGEGLHSDPVPLPAELYAELTAFLAETTEARA